MESRRGALHQAIGRRGFHLKEERYAQAVRSLEFDRELGPYALDQFKEWKSLSNYITESTIERIPEPIGGEITIASEPEMSGNIPKTGKEKALAEQLCSSKFSRSSDKNQKVHCYYTSVPRLIKHKGMCANELTSLNLDKTQLLEELLTKEFGGAEDLLLAELQFAFIAFLMGQSLESFLQWKTLLTLFFGCTEAPFRTRSKLFTKFIKVLYYQLKFGLQENKKDVDVERESTSVLFDESWLSADSFMYHLCKDFFQLILEAPVVDGDLISWTRKVKELLETTLGWSFLQSDTIDGIYFEDSDEFAPVVEMLDDHVQ
ncbi:uncharacterized protein LOC141670493 isoform X3 [Apium graveolens]|uniref:uncharacterized protein LOC141670493 isoform X3 n=1 Tax=Apium graveolens TaxID=4045 RepID=UPI003D7A3A34